MSTNLFRAACAIVLLAACSDGTTDPGSGSVVPAPAVSITAGQYYSCALNAAGQASCWGLGSRAQLGNASGVDAPLPTAVPGSSVYQMVDGGDPGACGLTRDGVAECWGAGLTNAQPTPVASPVPFVQVATGGASSCGLTKDGTAFCWGANNQGQLGNYTTTNTTQPTAVGGGLAFSAITVGLIHACGLTAAGDAYCWGSNSFGSLGNGTTTGGLGPTQVTGGIKFRSLSAGGAYTCGVSTTGAGYCWGLNSSLQLGVGTPGNTFTPLPVLGGLAFKSIKAGSGNSIFMATCGITTAGDAYCWGYNSSGQVGSRPPNPSSCAGSATGPVDCIAAPVKVPNIAGVEAVDPSVFHACAMLADRKTYCWGDNLHGELGDGTTTSSSAPVLVKGY